jgi:spore coat assembly protein SafA
MRENMLQQKEEGLATLAALGRNEDTYLAHVAPNEMIVPAQVLRDNPLLKTYVLNSISKYGVDPNKYIVGNGDMDLNPLTGLPEFGFLSKVFKKIKKVVKKVAPVAVNFIPGVGPVAKAALTAAAGKASGLSTRDALLAGATSFAGNKMFGGATPTGGSAATGNIFQRAKEYILPGQDKVGLFGNIRKGIGSFFGGDNTVVQQGDTLSSIAKKSGVSVQDLIAANPQIANPDLIQAGMKINIPGGGGRFFGGTPGQSRLGTIEDFIKGKTSDPVRQGGFLEGVMGGTPGQSQIGMIEDTLRGRPSDPVRQNQQSGIGGLFGGLAGGNLTIPALYGLASYYGAKRDEGGLAATPATTMDQLGRYQIAQNLGTGGSREDFGLLPAPKALQFAVGGEAVKELDMRQGGESAGPGTGTSDDIPAMLSDGEFVMTAKATRGAGAFDVNKTKSGIELIKGGSASREEGVKNMRELMNIFEAI